MPRGAALSSRPQNPFHRATCLTCDEGSRALEPGALLLLPAPQESVGAHGGGLLTRPPKPECVLLPQDKEVPAGSRHSVLAATQVLPGQLFPRSINCVLQIKIAIPMSENIKNSSADSVLLRALWERVRRPGLAPRPQLSLGSSGSRRNCERNSRRWEFQASGPPCTVPQ